MAGFQSRVRMVYFRDNSTTAYFERFEPDCDGWFWNVQDIVELADGGREFAETLCAWLAMPGCQGATVVQPDENGEMAEYEPADHGQYAEEDAA